MTTVPDPIPFLQMHRSTRGLSEAEIHAIARQVEVVRFEEDEVVHRPDQQARALLLVITGRLRVSAPLPSGAEKTILYVGRDEQFGLIAMTQDKPFPLTVVADHHSTLLRIPRESAIQLIHQIPLWERNLLQSLGPQFRDSLLGERSLKKPRIVALIHTCEQSRHLTALLNEQLTYLGEKVGLLSDHDDTRATALPRSASLLDVGGQLLTVDAIRKLLTSWTEADRVFLDVHVKHATRDLTQWITSCDAVYWCCTSETDTTVVTEMNPIIQSSPSTREKVFVIRLLAASEPVAPCRPELSRVCEQDFKLHWNGCGPNSPVRTKRAGLEHIIHHLRRVTIGLALGGGAARGMAHLGVLQVLEEAGITIDRMSGTSAGALTGILYAAGYSANFLIDAFARDLKPSGLYRLLPYRDACYMWVKFRGGGWEKMLRKYLQSWRLEQLAVPFSAVAVDLVSAETVIHRDGDAVNALLESINLPGIARPICRDGKTLVDGGVLNVVPANVLVNQGAKFVIASDVAAKIPFEFAGNNSATPTQRMKVPSRMATLSRVRAIQDRNIRSMGGEAADIVIEPDVSQVLPPDFKHAPEIAKLGRVAAEKALPELRRVLNAMDPQLFA